ncbi:MAG TPA: branched-chain amino acid ABC transporter permease [Candidatus Atribacteria bacterium]|nr:branched-chain amino acid ABC transporter permease [Candidatus Atribacteria bacterium]
MGKYKNIFTIILILLVIFLSVFPKVFPGYWVRVLTNIFMYGVLASALNIIAGYTGYVAFENSVFFGIGAYTAAVMMTNHNWNFYLSMGLGAFLVALFAFIVGFPLLRLRGPYFTIATIGVNGAVLEIVNNLEFTGGGEGITLPLIQMSPQSTYAFFYYLMFVVLLFTVIITYWLSRVKFGYALRAIKANEEAANAIGINSAMYKTLAWVISAVFTAFVGSIYAYWMTFIDPAGVFDIMIGVKSFVMMLLGGGGTVFGPLIGATILELISEFVWSNFLMLHLMILGTIIVITVMFMPRGIVAFFKKRKIDRRIA